MGGDQRGRKRGTLGSGRAAGLGKFSAAKLFVLLTGDRKTAVRLWPCDGLLQTSISTGRSAAR